VFLDASRARHPAPPAEARPRLEARLQRALNAQVALLVAAPGYGKTAALARLPGLDPRPPVWCTCVSGEAPGALPRHLAELIAGPFTLPRLDQHTDPLRTWRMLADVLAADAQPRLLLIDQIHYLSPADLDALMSCLAADIPPGWCAAVASTTDVHHPELAHLFADGQAAYLDERDFTFDQAEARTVARGLGRAAADADAAWERAAGWPLGVITILDGRQAWLPDYFHLRVLDRLTPRLRRFVEATLVLEDLAPDLCQAVTQSSDAASLLAEAIAAHVFVRQTATELPSYLPLFRTTLLDLQRRQQPRQLARWTDRAAQQLLNNGQPVGALRVASAGGGWSGAVALLQRIGPGAVAAGRAADLDEWIATFPVDLARQEPWLLYFKGVSMRLGGQYALAQQLQERARDGFGAAAIREGYAYALAELGTLALLFHRPADAEQLLGEARVALGDSDDVHQAAVLCSLADAYVALNRLREANQAGEAAVALSASDATSPTASVHVHAWQRVAWVRIREGLIASALDAVSRALELGRDHPLDAETNLMSSLLLGMIRWSSGDLESAEEVLDQARELAARDGLSRPAGAIDVVRAGVLADLGRLEEADFLFGVSKESSEFLGVSRQAGLGVLRLLQNRISEARAIFRELLESASIAGSAADVMHAKAALGVVALRSNRLGEAEQWLLDAARGFELSGARFRLAGTQLHLAELYLTRNDTLRCKRYLKLALDYAASAESYIFFLRNPATIGQLAIYALREGLQPEYVETFCMRRLGAAEVREFLPLLAERNPRLQAPARRIVDALLARESGLAIDQLEECADEGARLRLTRALVDGHLTPRGLVLLRHQYQLTWAEVCVFVEYYLTDLDLAVTSLEPERRTVARTLAISENTLRHHVTSIRQKLGLGAARGAASVFIWALLAGVADWPPSDASAMVGPRQSQSVLQRAHSQAE
jgi:tetratricopeptide (TPR) repeat protein